MSCLKTDWSFIAKFLSFSDQGFLSKWFWRCWTRLCQIVPFFLHTVISLWKWSRLPCQLFCALRRNMFLKTVWTFHLVCVCVFVDQKMSVSDQKISLKLVHNAFTCLLCLVKVQFLKTVWSLTASVHLFLFKDVSLVLFRSKMSLWKRSEVSLNLTIEIVFFVWSTVFEPAEVLFPDSVRFLIGSFSGNGVKLFFCCQNWVKGFSENGSKFHDQLSGFFWGKICPITVLNFQCTTTVLLLAKKMFVFENGCLFYSPTIVWKVADVLVSASLPLLLKQSFWKWSEGFIISFSALAAQKCLSENDLMACCWILVFFCSKVLFKTVGSFNAKVVVSSWSHMFSFFEMLWSVIAKFPASSILRFCWKCSEASLPNSFFLIKEYIIENCNAFHGQTVC